MEIDIRLKTILKELQDVPSVPFLPKLQIRYISRFLQDLGIKFESTNYAIVVPPKIFDDRRPKIIIMSHVDHPGVVLRDNTEGIFMGLADGSNIRDYLNNQPIPIKIYSPVGSYLGKGKITSMSSYPKQNVFIKTDIEVSANSYGQFDVEYFKEDGDNVYVYNADDGLCVATMLKLIEDKLVSDFNIYYVFNLFEEVHQITSWHLAKKNYFVLTEKDFVINLECAKVETIKPEKY